MTDPGIGEILAAVDEKREKSPADMVKNANVFMYLMDKEGNVVEDLEGRAIYEEFAWAQNNAYQAIDPTQEIDLNFNYTLDAFVYTPKQSVIPVMISELEKAQNRGPYKILDLIKSRGKTGESTMKNEINTDLNGDGTGRSGKAFAGIKTYITDTGTGAVGGVDRDVATAARNVFQDFTASPFSGATNSGNIEDRILYIKDQILEPGADNKLIGYAGSTYRRYIATALRGRSRIVDRELEAAGFGDHQVCEGIAFFAASLYNPQGGTVIAADRLYIMNPKVFKFRTYSGYNMNALKTRVSTRQLVDVGLRVCFGQFTCSDPSRTAVGFDS